MVRGKNVCGEPKVLGLEGERYLEVLGPGPWTPGKDPCRPGPELGCREGVTVSSHFTSSPSIHTLLLGAVAEISPPKVLVFKVLPVLSGLHLNSTLRIRLISGALKPLVHPTKTDGALAMHQHCSRHWNAAENKRG